MISRASSRRRTGSPNSFVVIAAPPVEPPRRPLGRATARLDGRWPGSSRPPASSGAVLHGGGGVVDGPLDVGVAGAPAEVAADHVVDLLLGELGRGIPLIQTGGDRHQEARCAEAALQRVALAKGLLHR